MIRQFSSLELFSRPIPCFNHDRLRFSYSPFGYQITSSLQYIDERDHFGGHEVESAALELVGARGEEHH